jgi:cell division protein FtsL
MSLPARRVATHEVPEPSRGAGALRRPQGAEGAKRPPRSAAAPAAPALQTRLRRKHHLGFAILATVVVAPMVLGIVSLNALLAQTSFRIDETERRIEELSRENLQLVHEQAKLSAPGRIADWASRNGMRLPDDIRFLHASGDRQAAPAGAADILSLLEELR